MQKQPKVAIITSTYNQKELLKNFLKILNKIHYKNYKVYLVDDSGKGEIGRHIKKDFPWVDVTINKKNMGYSTSNNLLFKKAIKDYNPNYILHLDDDTEIIDKLFLKKMIKVGESDKRIGILGCKIIYPDGNLQWFYKNRKINFIKKKDFIKESDETFKIKEVKNIIGACILIKKEVLDTIGLFDEKFSPAYGEETDLCYRASKKGFKLIYVGNTKIIHHGSSSTKTIFNEKMWFIKKRNSIRLEWLNYGFLKILKYSLIHFGSAILDKNFLKKLRLLTKAYKENIKNIKDIKQKREERNS